MVAGEPAPLRALEFTIQPAHGLERLAEADLIALPAVSDQRLSLTAGSSACSPDSARRFPEDLLEALRAAVDRGARVLGVCSGAFILGEAGLLDDRRCTTHWRNAAELARRYPRAKVDPDVLYVDDDPVITSAGTAAGIDACLYLVRKEQGSRVANGIARRMVVPPHRDGGQAQYVVQPVAPACDGSLQDLLEWLRAHLDQPLTVRQLAAARTCPSGPSPAASWPTPAPPRSGGSSASASCWPSSCWRRPTRRWTPSRITPASATRPPCAITSASGAAPPPTPTAVSSAATPLLRARRPVTSPPPPARPLISTGSSARRAAASAGRVGSPREGTPATLAALLTIEATLTL